MKTITLKIQFELPNEYKYVAQDKDGQLMAFIDKPVIDDTFNIFDSVSSEEIMLAHGQPNENWQNSLVEI